MSRQRIADGRHLTPPLTRSYSIPFSEVWDTVLATLARFTGWRLVTRDSHEGTIRVITLSPLRHRPMEADIKLSLDDLGQTRLEIRHDEPRHTLLPPAGMHRGNRFLKRVDRALAAQRRR